MRSFYGLHALLLACVVFAQEQTTTSEGNDSSTTSTPTRQRTFDVPSISPVGSTVTDPSVQVPTGPYQTITGQVSAPTVLTSSTSFSNASMPSNSSTTNPLLIIGGSTMSSNSTATTTSSSATPSNTQPCNNYPEFCNRRYSNITEVAAHNAAFVRKNNVFSNQAVPILGQLNDGIRMIQGEVHYENETLYNCHSDCRFLNTGTYESLLVTVRDWIAAHPYDVVTLLIVNSNFANVTVFREPFENSGILDYVYLPSRRPMRLNDWPTLGDMILTNKRVVVFMDYNADADRVPYILDQFSNMWETPFSPTDPTFPCTQQRPPGLAENQARNNYLYMANHNLNVEISLLGESILIPSFVELTDVNAANSSQSSLLTMAEDCTDMWGRPPNFLLVDFYDVGGGSVFEVAAEMNNVTYNRACCGQEVGLDNLASTVAVANPAVLAMLVALGFAVLGLL